MRSDRAVANRAQNLHNGEQQTEEALDRAKQHERKVAECEAQLVRAEKAITGL